MATVPPPPSKRRKLETLERSKDLQNILNPNSDDGVMRVQFFDERTGLPVGNGPILVPATDATYQNLELLLNKLEGYVSRSFLLGTYLDFWPNSDNVINSRTLLNINTSESQPENQKRRRQTIFQFLSRRICTKL